VTDRPPTTALLACDLDGTLIADDGSPVPGIVAALADLDARGARLVVCTGRPLHGAAKAVAVLRADPVAYVCYHGALVVDATTGEWLRHLTVPAQTVGGIVRAAHGLGLSVTLYAGDVRRELAAAAGAAPLDPGALAGITRVVLAGDPSGVAAALPALIATWGRATRVERAGGGTVAMLPAAADKGEGLKLVAAHLGVPGQRIVACGDTAADTSLLLAGAVRIAVGAAPAALRAAAQLIVSQDDLAEALRSAVASLG
jgi:hydroxymethylpyrimidine pyrophosphatase-like HAD family hydrolase